MVVAIVFPEILISSAWRQRALAKKLASRVTILVSKAQSGKHADNTAHAPDSIAINVESAAAVGKKKDQDGVSTWNSNQGFFAVMGGFSVRVRHENPGSGMQDNEYLLTPSGIEILAMADCLPAISKEDVEDRNNTDVITKIIVVCQVMWFALQVLSRLIAKMPITALEIHTTVHVGCAIMMYLFWFNKPYNIDRAIPLTSAGSREVAAMLVFRKLWAEAYKDQVHQYEEASERYWQGRVTRSISNLEAPPQFPFQESVAQAIGRYSIPTSDGTVVQPHREKVLRTLSKDARAGLHRLVERHHRDIVLPLLNRTDFPGLKQEANNFELRTVWGSWSSDTGHDWSREKLTNVLFNMAYGAAHLAAWSASSFPTSAERWIWRVSGLMLVAIPLWASLWIIWWKASTSTNKWLFIFRSGDLDIIGAPFFCAIVFAYTLARCYFLVEALVSLRALPEEAYQQVQWSGGFPHTT